MVLDLSYICMRTTHQCSPEGHNSFRDVVAVRRVLGLLTIMAALAGCGGSASGDASEAATTSVATASASVSGSPAATV